MDIDIHIVGHEQYELFHDGQTINVDKNISSVIQKIWNNKISTIGSCEGSKDGFAWITFKGVTSAQKFMDIIHGKINIKNWKFRSFLIIDEKIYGFYCRFNKKQKCFIIKDYNDDYDKLTISISFPHTQIEKMNIIL